MAIRVLIVDDAAFMRIVEVQHGVQTGVLDTLVRQDKGKRFVLWEVSACCEQGMSQPCLFSLHHEASLRVPPAAWQ